MRRLTQTSRAQALSAPECWELLTSHSWGRVAFTERALPAIVPVGYAVLGSYIVLRPEDDLLGRRLSGQVVAFQIDDGDATMPSGWTVTALGTAQVLDARPWRARAGWLAGDAGPAVAIRVGEVSGTRLDR